MKNYLLNEVKLILEDSKLREKRLAAQISSLSTYEGWHLERIRTLKSGVSYYIATISGKPGKRYLGNDRHPDVINVKRLQYAKEAADVLCKNIQLLEMLTDNYTDTDYATINSKLPVTYRTDISKGPSDTIKASFPEEAIKWKESLEQEKAKHPPYKPEQLKHPALDGTMMTSKSEVIIANIMIMAGIPFVYEVPMFIDGQMLLPDFRILSLIDLKTVIIIEHQGMVFVDDYADKFIRSLKLYLKSEWTPNNNLFFTFDNAKETLDVRQVMSVLRKHISPDL